MTIQRRKPIARRRAKPRRTRLPKCVVKRCGRPAKIVMDSASQMGGSQRREEVMVVGTSAGNRVPPRVGPVPDRTNGALCLSHAKAEADRRFSLVVRAVGRCERCGKTEGLSCSHFFSRRYTATRYVRLNAECLCFGCHKFLTEHPLEAEERARNLLGVVVWEELRQRALRGGVQTKIDLAAVLSELAP